MDYLNSILDDDAVNNIIETFDNELLKKLERNNIIAIINYLESNNIDFIEDILSYYTDLFILNVDEFIRRFEILKEKYGKNFCYNLAYKLDILESMWEYEAK